MNVSDRLKEIDAMGVSEFDNLKEGGDRIDEFWNPKDETIGSEFKGMYMGKRTFQGSDGMFDTLVLKDISGKVWGLPDAKILHDAVEHLQVGDALYVKYLGKEKPVKGSRKYHNFEVKGHKFDVPVDDVQIKKADHGREMSEVDDPEALSTIESYSDIFKSENYGSMPTAKDIIKLCDSDQDMTDHDKIRIKKQLAELVKRGDIKE